MGVGWVTSRSSQWFGYLLGFKVGRKVGEGGREEGVAERNAEEKMQLRGRWQMMMKSVLMTAWMTAWMTVTNSDDGSVNVVRSLSAFLYGYSHGYSDSLISAMRCSTSTLVVFLSLDALPILDSDKRWDVSRGTNENMLPIWSQMERARSSSPDAMAHRADPYRACHRYRP